MWTIEDVVAGACTLEQVGSPKDEASPSSPLTNASSPHLVQTYLDVFNEIGGKKALVSFAKDNPMKFYDQLLKLLVAMEAPKQTLAVQMNFGPMSDAALESLSTNDLKRRLLMNAGEAIFEAEP